MQPFIKKHKKGIIGAIVFHVALAILLFTFKFSTPLPLPAEKGILINFGDSETGSGTTEPAGEPADQQEVSPPTEQQQTDQGEEQVVTQNYEEAPVIEQETEEQVVEETAETETTPNNEQSTPTEESLETETEEEPVINPKTLYQGSNDSDEKSDGEGVTYGNNNQGSPTGSPASDNYANGNSKGQGGISFSLNGRNPQHLPKPEYNYQKEGIVVVAVTVNREGKVVQANPGVKGSTTLDDYLLKMAKKAAMNSNFDKKPEAPAYQKGTITYRFKLQ